VRHGKKRALWYVRADIRDSTRKMRTVLMHRFVMGLELGALEDRPQEPQRPGQPKGNLRVRTQAQNLQNVRPSPAGTSRSRGVSWDRHRKAWRAQVMVNGKHVLLKRFPTEREAAEAGAAALRAFMPFSVADQAA
jgi:hypothetical protein